MTSNINSSSLENHFRREFLNRIDDIIEFNDLGEESSEKLVELYINQLEENLNKEYISLIIDDGVLKFLADNVFDEKLGARNLKRSLDDLIQPHISDLRFDKKLNKGANLKLSILDNKLVVDVE